MNDIIQHKIERYNYTPQAQITDKPAKIYRQNPIVITVWYKIQGWF